MTTQPHYLYIYCTSLGEHRCNFVALLYCFWKLMRNGFLCVFEWVCFYCDNPEYNKLIALFLLHNLTESFVIIRIISINFYLPCFPFDVGRIIIEHNKHPTTTHLYWPPSKQQTNRNKYDDSATLFWEFISCISSTIDWQFTGEREPVRFTNK